MPYPEYNALFAKYAALYGLNPLILKAIAYNESSLIPGSIGDNGKAIGLMQIYKDTWEGGLKTYFPGVAWKDLIDPEKNIHAGAKLFQLKIRSINALYPDRPAQERLERAIIFYNGSDGQYTANGKRYLKRFYESINIIQGLPAKQNPLQSSLSIIALIMILMIAFKEDT